MVADILHSDFRQRDAILVVTFLTIEQNRTLTELLATAGKNLKTNYATHGHGDHFFGANMIRERFPNARFVSSPEVIIVMRRQASKEVLNSFWNSRFPGQIDANLRLRRNLPEALLRSKAMSL
jgi:glyoxylase-like metal-dependent hydrolase (beta-lactamase superfamily II)